MSETYTSDQKWREELDSERDRTRRGEFIGHHFAWAQKVPIYDPTTTARPIYSDGYGWASAVLVEEGFHVAVEAHIEYEAGVLNLHSAGTLHINHLFGLDTLANLAAAVRPDFEAAEADAAKQWENEGRPGLPRLSELDERFKRGPVCTLWDLIGGYLSPPLAWSRRRPQRPGGSSRGRDPRRRSRPLAAPPPPFGSAAHERPHAHARRSGARAEPEEARGAGARDEGPPGPARSMGGR